MKNSDKILRNLISDSQKYKEKMKRSILFCLILSFLVFSCARNTSYVKVIKPPDSKIITLPEKTDEIISDSYEVNGERYYRLPDSVGFIQTGVASWYGKDFHGRLTASGEVYDMHRLTAAHKTHTATMPNNGIKNTPVTRAPNAAPKTSSAYKVPAD